MFDKIAKYWEFNRIMSELSQLSDSVLKDIGIKRGEIKHIAHKRVYGN